MGSIGIYPSFLFKYMITINILRISPDKNYLEFDVNCIKGYVFDKFIVNTSDNDLEIDLGSVIYKKIDNNEIGRVPLTLPLYGGNKMYFITFTIKKLPDTEVLDRPCNCSNESKIAVAVDLSNFYFCMVDKALDLNAACQDERNKLINIYLMQAMLEKSILLERFDDASM